MYNRSHRTVAFLRSSATTIQGEMERAVEECNECPATFDVQRVSERLAEDMLSEYTDRLWQLLQETGNKESLDLALYDYVLNQSCPSRIATRWVKEANLIATVDPSQQLLAYVMTCMRKNPVLALLLAYTKSIDGDFERLSTQRVRVFDNEKAITQHQSRIFPISLKKEDNALQYTVAQALHFPYIKAHHTI